MCVFDGGFCLLGSRWIFFLLGPVQVDRCFSFCERFGSGFFAMGSGWWFFLAGSVLVVDVSCYEWSRSMGIFGSSFLYIFLDSGGFVWRFFG